MFDIFSSVAQNIDCVYKLEPTRQYSRVPTISVLDQVFISKIVNHCIPHFLLYNYMYIKVGFNGV